MLYKDTLTAHGNRPSNEDQTVIIIVVGLPVAPCQSAENNYIMFNNLFLWKCVHDSTGHTIAV